jgi:hypothetical protein
LQIEAANLAKQQAIEAEKEKKRKIEADKIA